MLGKRCLIFLSAMILITLGASPSPAITQAIYEVGYLLPYVYHGGSVDTAVGISVDGFDVSKSIFWSFHDTNGDQIASGSIPLQAEVFDYSFSLNNEAAGAGAEIEGWMVFTVDNNGILKPQEGLAAGDRIMAVNAFVVDLAAADALYIPAMPLRRMDYEDTNVNLVNMPAGSIVDMTYGHDPDAIGISSRYFIDQSGDPRTLLVVFTPQIAPLTFFATMFNTQGDTPVSLELDALSDYLNVFALDLEAPPAFNNQTDGSIFIENPGSAPIGIMFSLTLWSVVGAEQTTLAIPTLP